MAPKRLIECGKVAVAITGIISLGALVWFALDGIGIRPATIGEVRVVDHRVDTVATSVGWLKLANYENVLKRGGKLTREDCAKYRALAKRLGVPPKAC